MLSCKEATVLISQGMEQRLGLGERFSLALHLAFCRGCRNFHRQSAFLRLACQRHPARGEDGDCKD